MDVPWTVFNYYSNISLEGGAAVVASVLPMEYISAKYRTLVAQRVGWQLGGFFLAMLAYLIRSWRWLCVGIGFFWILLLPVMLMLVGMQFESVHASHGAFTINFSIIIHSRDQIGKYRNFTSKKPIISSIGAGRICNFFY
jgi:hypothetical protein